MKTKLLAITLIITLSSCSTSSLNSFVDKAETAGTKAKEAIVKAKEALFKAQVFALKQSSIGVCKEWSDEVLETQFSTDEKKAARDIFCESINGDL